MNAFKLGACSVVIAASALVFHVPAAASTESHRQVANELLDTVDMNRLMSEAIDVSLQLQIQRQPFMKPYEGTLRNFFEKHMSAESMREDLVDVYTEAFTEDELKQIKDFYATPVGKKTLKLMPAMLAKGAALGQKRVQRNLGELQRMIAQESVRLQNLQKKEEAATAGDQATKAGEEARDPAVQE